MAQFERDGLKFFDGYFKEPVISLDAIETRKQIDYILANRIKCISFNAKLIDFSFLSELDFVEEIYLSKTLASDYSDFYKLYNLKRIVVSIEKNEPDLDYSKFLDLEYLSIDWHGKFPDLTKNTKLKKLAIWKFRPKSKTLGALQLPNSLESFEITESNITDLKGLSLPRIKQFEAHYCNALASLEGIDGFSNELETLILDYCRKLKSYEAIASATSLNKIILGNCGSIANLNWLSELKSVKHFAFNGTNLEDGDVGPCFGIDYVSFNNRRHYNHKLEAFKQH